MKTKFLIDTNPHLKNEDTMRKLITRSVRSSCGVEGIAKKANQVPFVITNRKTKKIYQST